MNIEAELNDLVIKLEEKEFLVPLKKLWWFQKNQKIQSKNSFEIHQPMQSNSERLKWLADNDI